MTARALRIGFVIDDLGHGGAQRQLSLLAQALRDHAVLRVVTLSDRRDPYEDRLRAAGAEVVVLARRSGFELARLRALSASLREFRPDLVHGFLDASNAYAYLAARSLRVPVVLSLRSDRVGVGGVRSSLLRIMLRRADAVVVNSRAGAEHLFREIGVQAARVHELPNIVRQPAPSAAPDAALVGCVGRLVPLKRFEAVIDALPAVRTAVPGARLTIVGDGPCLDDLRRRARGLGSAVSFSGAVADAAPLIAGFGCLVVASEYEGLPNAALEAMAAGVPVAAVRAGDLPELIEDGITGCLAASAAPEELARAIVRALGDQRLRASAAREGPRIAAARFSAERVRDTLLAVYRSVTNESGASTVV
ncbi:MAG TPA: glycosyltransferase family 4 protein [Candidatus Krumholzibacteria bacterium]|nr:glycosyltransferase family 4 protein [Candidatus Krumholzibacteria bacterium]